MKRLIISLIILINSTTISLAEYPSKNIEFILLSDGGPLNSIGRLVIEFMKKHVNVDIIPITISGTGGVNGAIKLKNSAPNGYTITLGTALPFASYPVLKKNPPYDVLKDFEHVTEIYKANFAIVVSANSSIKNLKDIISSNQKSFVYGSPGPGSTSQIVGIILSKHFNLNARPVHYRGEPLTIPDLLTNRLDWSVLSNVKEFSDSGQIRVIATTGKERWSLYPEIPTLREQGLPFDYYSFAGIFAPKGLSEEVLTKLNVILQKVVNTQEFRERLFTMGFEPSGKNSKEFKNTVTQMIDFVSKISKENNLFIE